MKSDVKIILSGPNFPQITPIGATFNYGINQIPTAVADLDAGTVALLCDFESHRRKLVTLKVITTKGCVQFDGFIDGCSVSQSAGSLGMSLVIKSRYCWLLETTTTVPGLYPGSLNVFDALPVLSVDLDPENRNNFMGSALLGPAANARVVSMTQPLFQVVKTIFQVALELLADTPKVFKPDVSMAADVRITQASEIFLAEKLPLARAMLASMDTTAVDNMLLNASSGMIGQDLINLAVQSMTGSLFEALIQMVTQYGCILVCANNKMYVLPDCGFIRMPHVDLVARTKQSSVACTIFPAEYISYNFNDQGYRDIKGCYLASEPGSMPMLSGDGMTRTLGHFVDDQAIGGILVGHLPKFVSGPLEYLAMAHSGAARQDVQAGVKVKPEVLTAAEQDRRYQLIFQDVDRQVNDYVEQVGNNWAQLTYLKLKLADRTGSISAVFNPNWAPGAVGTLYCRYPGTWIDFRVTSVTHSFASSPGAAQANTAIQFDCGRMGGATSKGVDRAVFYDYDYSKSLDFANDFIGNIG